MFNLLKQKKKEFFLFQKQEKEKGSVNIIKPEGDFIGTTKYYPSSTQEWRDSVYTFNKSTSKLIPVTNNHIFNLIKSYFNMFSKNLEKKIELLRIRKWKRRLLGRKIWISKPELKYSNQKIIVNISVYNRQYNFLLKRLFKLKANWGKILKKLISRTKTLNERKVVFRDNILKIFKIINNKKYKQYKFSNAIELIKTKIIKSITDYKHNPKKYEDILDLADFLEKNPNFINKETIKFITKKSYYSLIQKMLSYQIIFLRNKQMILLNRLKFKDAYLTPIKRFLEKIYKKKIDINLVSLKKFNYDSSILSQIVTSKIRNRRNRPLKVVKASVRKSKIYEFNKGLLRQEKVKFINKQNYVIGNSLDNVSNSSDSLNDILIIHFPSNTIQKTAFNSIRNKVIAGIRVQASGRITRRIIAQRATSKIRYKGSLKNIDSSYTGIYTVILKGYEKCTSQYAHSDSKRRIGAFGVKTWINAY